MFIAQSIAAASGTSSVIAIGATALALSTASASGSSTSVAASDFLIPVATIVGQSSALAVGVGYIPQKPKPVTIYAVPQVVNLVYPAQ
jgi:hypothetical protein